jgi:serine/threonine protein kinase
VSENQDQTEWTSAEVSGSEVAAQPVSQNQDPTGRDPLHTAVQSRLPGIAEEIEGAIHTLRKLQGIAGPALLRGSEAAGSSLLATAAGAQEGADPLAQTVDPTVPPDSVGGRPDGPAHTLVAGETFGRYQIVRLLGRGAMGAVYLAYDSQLQRHVALKTPTLGGNPQTIDRFFREARAAAQLRSPYLCPVYDVGQLGGIYYLSMAFIDGKPLGQVMAEGRFKDTRVIGAVLAKLARGMQKAHEASIIHRDLKPDNIMIDADTEPIIMDFGLARRSDDITLTAAGKLLGTPAYMSPEQVEGDPTKLGPATDIYSLGVVLYQLLTGQLPFRGSLTSVLFQIARDEPPRPSVVRPELGAGSPLEHICLRMMAKAPADRYPCMADVARAVEEAFAPRAEAPAAPPSAWQRLWTWLTHTSTGPRGGSDVSGASSAETLAK